MRHKASLTFSRQSATSIPLLKSTLVHVQHPHQTWAECSKFCHTKWQTVYALFLYSCWRDGVSRNSICWAIYKWHPRLNLKKNKFWKSLLLFISKSVIITCASHSTEDENIQNNFASCFVWVCHVLSYFEGRICTTSKIKRTGLLYSDNRVVFWKERKATEIGCFHSVVFLSKSRDPAVVTVICHHECPLQLIITSVPNKVLREMFLPEENEVSSAWYYITSSDCKLPQAELGQSKAGSSLRRGPSKTA